MALAGLFLLLAQDPVAEIDKLAVARNVDALAAYASSDLVKADAFRFLKRGGPFGGGALGWHAVKLDDVDGTKTYVVFTTSLTCEDLGEQVFVLSGGKLVAKVPELEDLGCRVKHWDLTVGFDTSKKTANIVAETLFRSTKTGSFLVRLSPHYKVKSVTDSAGRPVGFKQAGGTVSLKRPATADFRYTFKYSGVVSLKGYAGDMSDKEMMLTEDYWYPTIARGAATHKLTITTPKSWTVVAQGEQVDRKVSGPNQTVKFQMDLPCSYLSLAAGEYKTVSRTVEGTAYKVWSRVLSDDQMGTQLELLAPVIQFYDKTFGKMPFSGFGQLVTGLYSGGALEAYSYATYGPGWLPAEDAHEPAHTWFGGMLDNTYLKSFWNESFADWCDGYYHRNSPFGNAEERLPALLPTPFANPQYWQGTCETASVDLGPAASSLGYGKGAEVLLQMEQEFPEMLDWIRKWVKERQSGRESEWSDFEKACGPGTKWFFDQWIRRKGFPKFSVTNVRYEEGKVRGHVAFDGAPYRLTVDVLARTAGGDTFQKVVLNPGLESESDFEFPVSSKPSLVALDPWERLLIERKPDQRTTLANFLEKGKYYVESDAHKWLETWALSENAQKATMNSPKDWDGYVFVGNPQKTPQLMDAIRAQGIRLTTDRAYYKGTEVELAKGGLGVIVDLPSGGHCAIVLGSTKVSPNLGHARLGLFDAYGRLLRAKTDPVVQGPLAFDMK